LYAGEKVYQNAPAGCVRWWKSFNGVDPYWDIITGAPCGLEGYEDIGWDYDLLMPGDPWTLQHSLGLESPAQTNIYAACYDPTHEVFVIGTGNDAQLWVSDDGGGTWDLKKDLSNESPAQERVVALAYDPTSDLIFAGTYYDAQVWVSDDGGDTWTEKYDISDESPSDFYARAIGVDPNIGTVVVGTGSSNAMIHLTDDGGDTWDMKVDLSDIENFWGTVKCMTYDSSRALLFAGCGTCVWKSGDGGKFWAKVHNFADEIPAQTLVIEMCYDATNDILVIGTGSDGQL
jgi:photosystem II stability/assembly factor-like uncharacterized protein